MAVVMVFTHHVPLYALEDRPMLPAEWTTSCACGWREKGYGEHDVRVKAEAHQRTSSTWAVLLPPLVGEGRWRA